MEESSLLIIASCENRGGGAKNLRQCWFDKKSYWASRKHVSTDMEVNPKQKFRVSLLRLHKNISDTVSLTPTLHQKCQQSVKKASVECLQSVSTQ